MSVDCKTYAMYGAIIPYGELRAHYDALEPYFDEGRGAEFTSKDGLTVIYDGMSGKYVAVGKVLAKTDDDGGFDAPTPLTIDTRFDMTNVRIRDLLCPLGVEEWETGFFVLSHYS